MSNGSDEGSIVITGGSGGVGSAVARLAVAEGRRIWIGYGTGEDRARALARELGSSAAILHLPLDDPGAIRESLAGVTDASALVLAASPPPDVISFLKLDPRQLGRQLNCTVIGNHAIVSEIWRRSFRPRGGGSIVAVLSSAVGEIAAPHMASYVAAKGGLEALLRAAVAELGPAGLRVSIARPGYIETQMLNAFPSLAIERSRLSHKFLTPEQVATALLNALDNPIRGNALGEIALEPKMAFS